MADIKEAFELIVGYEGLYSNDKNDTGGETVLGLTRKYEPNWQGWVIVDACKKTANFKATLKEREGELRLLAIKHYKKEYWDCHNLDKVDNQQLANEMFDIGVNQGIGYAGLFLQRSLNVLNHNGKDYPDLKVDGQVGEKTVAIVNAHKNPEKLVKCLNALQGARYITITEANPVNECFINGWLQRI
jgi:lysozyme family protein